MKDQKELEIARNIAIGLGKMLLFKGRVNEQEHFAEGAAMLEEGIKNFMPWLKEEL